MMSDFVAIGPRRGGMLPAKPRWLAGRAPLALHGFGIAALALVLVASGAFDSDDLSLGRRLLMFGVISVLLVGQASLLADIARRAARDSLPALATAAAAAVLATLGLMTIELHLLKSTPVLPYAPDPLPEFALFLFPFVVPVSGFVLALRWSAGAAAERPAPPRAVPEPRPAAPPAASPDGWPVARILRLRAADHYLELWTSQGRQLVRGRLGDALRRLPDAEGVQPHRSWWVALSEIDRIDRQGRDLVLRLVDGERVPLARSRAREVKRALRDRRGDGLDPSPGAGPIRRSRDRSR